jgi:hypothetical protein
MADLDYPREEVGLLSHPNWGAIWAGMFSFLAIWSVFGMLGFSIFASSANPNAAHPVTGLSVGMAVWGVILTIIAMFVGGRVTGQLAGISNVRHGMVQGMIMFGLSVAAALIIIVLGGNTVGATQVSAGAVHSSYVLTLLSDLGWTLFVALFLGWLAAMAGASSAIKSLPQAAVQRRVTTHA